MSTEPAIVKSGRWSPQEDESLCLAVQIHGPKKWALISELVPGRSAKACHFRWNNEFSLERNRAPFTMEEDRTLLRHYATLGRKWATIGRMLNGRSGNAVKNRFNMIQSLGLLNQEPTDQVEAGGFTPQVSEPRVEQTIIANEVSVVDPDHSNANANGNGNADTNYLIDDHDELPTPAVDFISSTALVVISDPEPKRNEFDQVSDQSAADANLVQLINKIVNEAVDKSMSTLRDQMDKTISTLRNQMDYTVSTLRNQMDHTIPTLREEMSSNIAAIVRKEVARYNNSKPN